MIEKEKAGHEARRLCHCVARGELAAQGRCPRLGASEVTANVGDGGAHVTCGNVHDESRRVVIGGGGVR